MKRKFSLIVFVVLAFLLISASLTTAAGERTVVIGFTASQTGKYNVESTRQVNGLNLWLNQVNDAGGITLSDGTVITFKTVSYDDESATDRVQELYTRLATDDNADFLISPYSSGLTDASAVIAEQYNKIMITTGAASDSTYQKGYTLVFQTYTPASRYLTGALDLLGSLDDSAKRIAIVHENDKFSTDVSNALNDYALSLGYEVVLFDGYDTGTTDFAAFVNKIQDAAPDAVLGGGHFQDGTTFARQLQEKGVTPKFVALLVAPPEPTFAELGAAAIGIVGPSQWEPLTQISADPRWTKALSIMDRPARNSPMPTWKPTAKSRPTMRRAATSPACCSTKPLWMPIRWIPTP